jgi:hypothetical protein
MAEGDEPTFTIISISLSGDGDRYLLELYDTKLIEAAKRDRRSRGARWDSLEHALEHEGVFPFMPQTQRVFLPVTTNEFLKLAPFVGMVVRVSISPVGA